MKTLEKEAVKPIIKVHKNIEIIKDDSLSDEIKNLAPKLERQLKIAFCTIFFILGLIILNIALLIHHLYTI